MIRKMKDFKKVLLLFCCFLFLFIYPSPITHHSSPIKPVFAQRQMDDYLYQYEKYRNIHQEYLQAREKYLKYQTLTSRDELIQAGQDFLYARSIVIRTYLQALEFDLKKAPNVVAEQKTELVLSLDEEIDWLLQNEDQIKELDNPTLDDLLEISLRIERREVTFNKLAYLTLSNIVLGKMRLLQTEALAINSLLNDEIIKSENGDLATLNQWLETAKNITFQSQKQIETAESYLSLMNSKAKKKEGILETYGKIKAELEQARSVLLGGIDYQREILREVSSE